MCYFHINHNQVKAFASGCKGRYPVVLRSLPRYVNTVTPACMMELRCGHLDVYI